MDSGTQKDAHAPKPKNVTNCQSINRPDSGGVNIGTGYLFWSSETQFDSRKLFEELSRCFMDCDVNCNICVNFIFALNQHIRAAHSKLPESETGGQSTSQNCETERQGSFSTTASNEAKQDEQPRLLNVNGEEILIVDLEDETETMSKQSFPSTYQTTIAGEEEKTQNLLIPMDETMTEATEAQVPAELHLIPCRFCRNNFLYSELKSHAEAYHPEELVNIKIYRCRLCGLDTTFMSGDAERQHIYESHPGEMPYVCKFCNKGVSHIRNHVHYCSGRRRLPFPCGYCDKRLASKSSLNRHVFLYHTETRNCEICGRNFFTDKKLTEHKQKIHLCSSFGPNDPKPETVSKTKMQPQKKVKVKRFECSTCEKKFFKSESLFRHLEKKHKENVEQEQPYFCGVCDKAFVNDKKLLSHRRKLHPEPEVQNCEVPKQTNPKKKRYICQLCNKEYKNRIKYKQHLRTHTTTEFPNGETV